MTKNDLFSKPKVKPVKVKDVPSIKNPDYANTICEADIVDITLYFANKEEEKPKMVAKSIELGQTNFRGKPYQAIYDDTLAFPTWFDPKGSHQDLFDSFKYLGFGIKEYRE